jgi:hypothetical protein
MVATAGVIAGVADAQLARKAPLAPQSAITYAIKTRRWCPADLHQHLGRPDAARSALGGVSAAERADRADGWMYGGKGERSDEAPAPEHGATDLRLDDHFGSDSTLQRNERVKLAASF